MDIEQCQIVELPKIRDPRGNLSFMEAGRQIPFEIKRVFYFYDVPGGETRAVHALKKTEEFIIAAAGSFDVILDNGGERRTERLNCSWRGVYVPPKIWRELTNFSSDAICLVLASTYYDESEKILDYQEFLREVGARS